MAFGKKFDKNKRPRRPAQSALFKRKRVCRFTAEGVEQIDYKNVPDGTMLASIMKIMKDAGAGEDDINKLIQLVVQALPETSILKSRQKRTGVAGYMNDNAAYVFDRVTSNSARQIARMRYGQQIKQTLSKMREDQAKLRGDDSADAAAMLEDLAGRYDFAMNPRISSYEIGRAHV